MGKYDPKIGLFLYFEKLCHWFLLEMYFNKNRYCSGYDLTGRDLGFMTKFWISTTELFVIMNSCMITERNKNQWIYQWTCDIQMIWKSSHVNLLRIIIFELFEHWTFLTVFLFLVLILSIWLTIKPNNVRKFYFWIFENMIKRPSLWKWSYKISSVCLSISLSVCLSVCLWHSFSGST